MTVDVTRLNNGLTIATDRIDGVESAALGVCPSLLDLGVHRGHAGSLELALRIALGVRERPRGLRGRLLLVVAVLEDEACIEAEAVIFIALHRIADTSSVPRRARH